MNPPTVKQTAILVATLLGLCTLVFAAVDVDAEINRLQTQFKNMKPPPELIGNLLQQIQSHCKNQRKIDQASLNNASKCVEQYMNETQLIDDVKKAVPDGKLDDVFRGMCLKWPKIRGCLKEFFVIIEDCWQKGDKVTKIVDESVKFFCGDDNDGSRIALFLAEGGFECLEKHGDGVKKCMADINEFEDIPEDPSQIKIPDPNNLAVTTDEICEKMEELATCTGKELKKCRDTTPENLVTSMLHFSSGQIGCNIKPVQTSNQRAGSVSASGSGSFSSEINTLVGWIVTSAVVAGVVL